MSKVNIFIPLAGILYVKLSHLTIKRIKKFFIHYINQITILYQL